MSTTKDINMYRELDHVLCRIVTKFGRMVMAHEWLEHVNHAMTCHVWSRLTIFFS